jgi:hypothetical protein
VLVGNRGTGASHAGCACLWSPLIGKPSDPASPTPHRITGKKPRHSLLHGGEEVASWFGALLTGSDPTVERTAGGRDAQSAEDPITAWKGGAAREDPATGRRHCSGVSLSCTKPSLARGFAVPTIHPAQDGAMHEMRRHAAGDGAPSEPKSTIAANVRVHPGYGEAGPNCRLSRRTS